MKTKYFFLLAAVLAGFVSTASAYIYSQNFDGMGPTGTTAPAGWSMLYVPGIAETLTLPTSADMASAVAGQAILAVWNQTDTTTSWIDQAANMGSSGSATDRLLGTSPSQTQGSIIQLSLVNNAGHPVSSVSIAYDMKCMAYGTLKNGYDNTFVDEFPGYRFYFLDGSTWMRVGSLDLANDTLNSVGHASADVNFSAPVPDGGTMVFRWFDDNAEPFGPDTMYAIDNVSVLVPEPGTLSLLAVGALALVYRRRKA